MSKMANSNLTEGLWDKNRVVELITHNDRALTKALMVVYKNQTESEKATMSTKEHNGVGFTGFDAEFLTSLAVHYQKKGFLSVGQLVSLRKVMVKYWRQLLKAAELSGHQVSYK